MDKLAALYEAMGRLMELGHRRIVVTEYEESPTRMQTEAVIESVCREHGLGTISDVFAFDSESQ